MKRLLFVLAVATLLAVLAFPAVASQSKPSEPGTWVQNWGLNR